MILVAILKRFLQILMDFGRIQMVFWKGFGGITNDCKRFRLQNLLWWLGRRGADQEDLIICLAIWMPNIARPPLISAEAGVIAIASRNRLRSTSLCEAFFFDFGGFWGGFWRPKRKPKSIFRVLFSMFYSHAFWHRFRVDFWRLKTWKINKNHCFFNGFC